MNKAVIVESILLALQEEFKSYQSSSKQIRSAGNDPESKSEGKYDTRSIEENYLADGLAKQAQAAVTAAAAYDNLVLATFDKETPIDIGALVQLEFPDETTWFFLGPSGGGIDVVHEGLAITVITPESPLGRQLIGHKVGERITVPKAQVRAVE